MNRKCQQHTITQWSISRYVDTWTRNKRHPHEHRASSTYKVYVERGVGGIPVVNRALEESVDLLSMVYGIRDADGVSMMLSALEVN